MALIDVDVVRLLTTGTAEDIANADYSTLRFNLLQRAPIGNVVSPIYEVLNQQLKADKDRFHQQFVLDACAEQTRLDQEESQRDAEEGQEDGILHSKYMGEMRLIAHSLRHDLEPRKQSLQSLLFEAQRNEAQLQQAKQRLEEMLRNMTTPNRETNVHGHEDAHQHVHPSEDALELDSNHHGHPSEISGKVHGHPSQTSERSPRENEHRHPSQSNSNEREIQRLSSELQTLASSLKIAKEQTIIAQTNLDRAEEEIRTAKTRSDFLQQQLSSVLPEKQRIRTQRATHRLERAAARLYKDDELKQLCQENREKLGRRLQDKFSELDQLKKELLDRTTSLSYPIFLNLLEKAKLPHLTPFEEIALRSIFKMMKAYQQMGTELSQLQTAFTGMSDNLRRLRDMVAQNQILELENIRLSQDKITAEQRKQDWFNVTLFSGGVGLVLTGIGYAYELSPLFFMCPAALGALSVVAAITTLVYYCSQHTTASKVIENENTIARNNATVLVDLSSDKTLAGQIKTADQEIARLRSAIEEKASAMERVLDQASQVEVKIYLGDERIYTTTFIRPFATPQDAHNDPEQQPVLKY